MGYIEELRDRVGNRPLVLTGVAVLVFDQHNRFLMVKNDNMWKFPGGFIELGESAEEAGIREIYEETGMNIENLQLIGVFSGKDYFTKLPNGDEYYPVTIAYATNDIVSGHLKPDGIETQKVEFFSSSFLPKNLSPRDLQILNSYKGKKSSIKNDPTERR